MTPNSAPSPISHCRNGYGESLSLEISMNRGSFYVPGIILSPRPVWYVFVTQLSMSRMNWRFATHLDESQLVHCILAMDILIA